MSNCINSKETDDRLLLSLSHAPLPTRLLDILINETSHQCHDMLNSIADVQKHGMDVDSHYDEEKKDHQLPLSKRNTILHILATGTPYVIKPGKSQPDYIHQWTKGEVILARLVEKIGMEKFHRVPKDGETKLAGRLIDVKPSDFEFILNHSTSNNDEESNQEINIDKEQWEDDCLMEELSWIANNILRTLNLDNRPKIGFARVLFPLDPRFEHVDEKRLSDFIYRIFEKEWSLAKGPLHDADIDVMIVKTSEKL